ncbi:MAG: hypothetical protein Q7T73_00770 [Beijerinckiaceae bacterium]|nr:hypothetical protein [Beijerinckiaceae bacterium]
MTFDTAKYEHDKQGDVVAETPQHPHDKHAETHGGLTREELRAIVVEMIG